MKTSRSKHEVEPKSQRELQQEALQHLKEHGPLNWNAL